MSEYVNAIINVLLSLLVGLYTGVVVMRISSFNQYRIYAMEVMFGVSSTPEPIESDFEPECVDVDDAGEPVFQNNSYMDACINYWHFGAINLGSYEKFRLVGDIFKELGHENAALTCCKIYNHINNIDLRIHEAMLSTTPSDDHITPHYIHEKHPKWESAIIKMKPNWWAIFKPFPNGIINSRKTSTPQK